MTQISLVFDDGFAASCQRIATIFEERDLHATFAVLVDPSDFTPNFPKGDFGLWNELQARGHVIQPHGYDHSDLTLLPYQKAVEKIQACLQHFEKYLAGFEASQSIYHLTYNRSTPALESYLLQHVRAIRTTRDGKAGSGFNTKNDLKNRILSCAWHGPEPCNEHFLETLSLAEREQPPLMLYMLHGLDGEGWGPLDSNILEHALDTIVASPGLAYANLNSVL